MNFWARQKMNGLWNGPSSSTPLLPKGPSAQQEQQLIQQAGRQQVHKYIRTDRHALCTFNICKWNLLWESGKRRKDGLLPISMLLAGRIWLKDVVGLWMPTPVGCCASCCCCWITISRGTLLLLPSTFIRLPRPLTCIHSERTLYHELIAHSS